MDVFRGAGHRLLWSALVLTVCLRAQPSKPATINVQAAILSTKEGQRATRELASRFNARKQALEKRQSDLSALQTRMRTGSATLSRDARNKLMADIDAQTKAWNRDSAEFNADVQQDEGKIMNDIGGKMLILIGKYATEHGILLVADVSNPQTPVIWADPSNDITNDIVKLYDQAYPAAAAEPAPAKKP